MPFNHRPRWRRLVLPVALMLAAAGLRAQSLAAFEKRVTEFTLPNGMHFILVERHDAPVVSFHSYVNAGSVDDPGGETGLAHMFEHMAFKGTTTIGTTNYPAEKKAMAEVERVYDAYDAERDKAFRADPKKLAALQAELKAAMAKAESFVVPNAYPRIIDDNGGEGLNAQTSEDSTEYFYSLPSNRIELWFLLESDRFYDPVFREFYKERDVVREERRMRVESNPQGQLVEMLLATAFTAHPYRVGAGGWSSDIENLRLKDAYTFYKTYYAASNITIGIAGDADPRQVRALAAKYFARIPGGPPPPMVTTVEPKQDGEKRVRVDAVSQPLIAFGYKRADKYSPDDAPLEALGEILSGGRTSMLYKELVRDRKLALGAFAAPGFPGGKYPNLFVFYLVPNLGRSIEENERACLEIIERVKEKGVGEDALKRVKTKVRASLIRQLDSNSGLAEEMASYYGGYGDWRKLFTEIDDIDKVTVADVQRVAKKYLLDDARTVAFIEPSKPEAAPAAGEAQ